MKAEFIQAKNTFELNIYPRINLSQIDYLKNVYHNI